ncbi:MAG: hypothetical protein BSOLF_0481 [Candidatus Carbobacillus altaicus]|uniref:Uncharacterized protein n=1 Tax=Candidatus Carbonibacillus altaicus TaxID=2163959 RepID=A0A2R6Y0U7_9BACL|nr:MAG: hypothetical protein BSOLF_0481 [Candidatus Carbobacillus altaicus]
MVDRRNGANHLLKQPSGIDHLQETGRSDCVSNEAPGVMLTPAILRQVEERGTSHLVVSRDLGRLYKLYQRALDEVALTESEARLIYEAYKGVSSEVPLVHTAALLAANIRGVILERRLDEAYSVDGAALIEKLRGLTEIQALAIIDAVERLAYGAAFRGMDEAQALRMAFRFEKP